MMEKWEMGSKHRSKGPNYDSDLYDDFDDLDDFDEYEEAFDDDSGSFKRLSRDFYSTDWEDPSRPERRISARRRIERRKELRDLYSQFDDGEELDLGNEW